ncbi:TrbI/VirB10 family protein [Sphingomonas sp. CGMCC 1.13654]|uniref:TrbI/VirB10 family protein n=1 Tax=Sphingomonas chungangi TaxID=2683589 RepID=A0A838L4I3_9SPHN|nr:TrbI/VirB10 family protein [Sphingomonas chungangi]MBA2932558.1 TrbI/VirB10 family protein [Sphingomonas chungangi]MVW56181.1 type VI secretion protein [Sphingomonas chungangi]
MSTTTRQPILLRPIEDSDPRILAEPRELQLASRNAYPLVAQQGRKSDSLGLAAGAGIALLLGGVTFWSMSAHRAPSPEPQTVTAPVVAPLPAPMVPQRPVAVPLPVAPPAVSAPAIAAAASPALVFDNSQAPASPAATTTPVPGKTADGKQLTGDDNDQFALRVGGSSDVATAEPMTSPSDTIAQGTLIPAVLETAIDTDLPGYVRAVVSRDVKSFDGAKVLIPRSSRLVGQYKSGLAAGQTRAYVIWSRLIRPDGVSVALGSPAVDFTGESGLSGKVDSHFFKRFSSAVLLSVVGGLSSIAGNASVIVSGGQSAASVAAQRDTSIAPTVKVPQGQPIRVFTARDLDFSSATAG